MDTFVTICCSCKLWITSRPGQHSITTVIFAGINNRINMRTHHNRCFMFIGLGLPYPQKYYQYNLLLHEVRLLSSMPLPDRARLFPYRKQPLWYGLQFSSMPISPSWLIRFNNRCSLIFNIIVPPIPTDIHYRTSYLCPKYKGIVIFLLSNTNVFYLICTFYHTYYVVL